MGSGKTRVLAATQDHTNSAAANGAEGSHQQRGRNSGVRSPVRDELAAVSRRLQEQHKGDEEEDEEVDVMDELSVSSLSGALREIEKETAKRLEAEEDKELWQDYLQPQLAVDYGLDASATERFERLIDGLRSWAGYQHGVAFCQMADQQIEAAITNNSQRTPAIVVNGARHQIQTRLDEFVLHYSGKDVATALNQQSFQLLLVELSEYGYLMIRAMRLAVKGNTELDAKVSFIASRLTALLRALGDVKYLLHVGENPVSRQAAITDIERISSELRGLCDDFHHRTYHVPSNHVEETSSPATAGTLMTTRVQSSKATTPNISLAGSDNGDKESEPSNHEENPTHGITINEIPPSEDLRDSRGSRTSA